MTEVNQKEIERISNNLPPSVQKVKEAVEKAKKDVSDLCRMSINMGRCDPDDCEFCSIGHAYEREMDDIVLFAVRRGLEDE